MNSVDDKLKACKNCLWFGAIDSYFPMQGICRKHMRTVHMNFICDDWKPLWNGFEKA